MSQSSVITSGAPAFFYKGQEAGSRVVGYENNRNRVARYGFTTPAFISNNVKITIPKVTYGGGSKSSPIRFYITKDSESYKNAGYGSAYHGVFAMNDGAESGGSASVTLEPDTTYYVWIFPGSTIYGYWYAGLNDTTPLTITVYEPRSATLVKSEAAGTKLTVYRLSSIYGLPMGGMITGQKIYIGDVIRLNASAYSGYLLAKIRLNYNDFVNGNSFTVDNSFGDGTNIYIDTLSEKIYNLSYAGDPNVRLSIYRVSSNYGSLGAISTGSPIYVGDVIKISAASTNALYDVDSVKINGAEYTQNSQYTVSGDVVIFVGLKSKGSARIFDGTNYKIYMVYIYDGTTFKRYQSYVSTGNSWEPMK